MDNEKPNGDSSPEPEEGHSDGEAEERAARKRRNKAFEIATQIRYEKESPASCIRFPRIRELVDGYSDQKRLKLPFFQAKGGWEEQCDGPRKRNELSGVDAVDTPIGHAVLAIRKIRDGTRNKFWGCCNMYGKNGECCHILDEKGVASYECNALKPEDDTH